MKRLAAVLLGMVLLAVAGCGGGGGDTTGSDQGTESASRVADSETGSQARPGQGTNENVAKGNKTSPSKPPGGLAPKDTSSLPNEGSKEIAPGVPTVKGGDNSIQSYGLESSGDERAEAATAVQSYLEAQAAKQWSRACAMLAAYTRSHLEALYRQKVQPGKGGCPPAMAAIASRIPMELLRTVAEVRVRSMRVQGDRGFLIYQDARGEAIEAAMQHEKGTWKVRVLFPKELLLH